MKIRKHKNKDFWKRYMSTWNGLIIPRGKYYNGKYASFMLPRIMKDGQDFYPSIYWKTKNENGAIEDNCVWGIARYIKNKNLFLIQDANICGEDDEEEKKAHPGLYLCKSENLLDYYTHYGFVGGRDIWRDSCNDRFENAYKIWHDSNANNIVEKKFPISLNCDGRIS